MGKEARMTSSKRVAWYLWPFWAIWQLLTWILGCTGRLVAVILGFVLMVVGVVLTITVVGAIIGIPLIIVGFLLLLRGLFSRALRPAVKAPTHHMVGRRFYSCTQRRGLLGLEDGRLVWPQMYATALHGLMRRGVRAEAQAPGRTRQRLVERGHQRLGGEVERHQHPLAWRIAQVSLRVPRRLNERAV